MEFLFLWVILGCIPAVIAMQFKGRGFVLWWMYGFLLFPIALIHSLVTADKRLKCPACLRPVEKGASICPNCRTPLV